MKRILVIDDAATVRLYHRAILEAEGYQVVEAANGIEGLEKALQQNFDLYLVDVNMPKMDGYTFCQYLRSEELQAAPALMITSDASGVRRVQAYVAGANDYLVKPARPDALLTHVRVLLGEVES
jgi:two-component system chemotaxis response regulator CheY